ncbi:hypothetical protein Lche_1451 [Legionella cherrii]|uniref:Uncharacterized protein n=1 Tax=Legionella cherrii TaxID=28084 RepID=A0A0W0S7M7_9GAMM|nr:hypothetical protein [Legionella cherrii]KTC79431.1 hypothetical protein Lche_1451 [Legionella cherrii]
MREGQNAFDSFYDHYAGKSLIDVALESESQETAETTAHKDLELCNSNQIFSRGKNMCHERKMKQYGKAVHNFIKNNNIDLPHPSFFTLLDQYRIQGLVQFCDEQINSKPQYILQ